MFWRWRCVDCPVTPRRREAREPAMCFQELETSWLAGTSIKKNIISQHHGDLDHTTAAPSTAFGLIIKRMPAGAADLSAR